MSPEEDYDLASVFLSDCCPEEAIEKERKYRLGIATVAGFLSIAVRGKETGDSSSLKHGSRESRG